MDQLPQWEHTMSYAAVAITTIVGCVAGLFAIMRSTYSRMLKDLGVQLTAVMAQNLGQQEQINTIIASRKSDHEQYEKERISDHLRAKKRENRCRSELAKVKEEMLALRQRCPLLDGAALCTLSHCPVSTKPVPKEPAKETP